MRKDTRAGIIAGAVSGLPLGSYFAAEGLPRMWNYLWSNVNADPNLASFPNASLIVFLLGIIVMFGLGTILSLFLGAIIGFVFVRSINKIHERSTYIKAIVPSILLWLIRLSYTVTELAVLGFYVMDSVIFAYLFDQWTKPTQP